jgi:hypothetical protein
VPGARGGGGRGVAEIRGRRRDAVRRRAAVSAGRPLPAPHWEHPGGHRATCFLARAPPWPPRHALPCLQNILEERPGLPGEHRGGGGGGTRRARPRKPRHTPEEHASGGSVCLWPRCPCPSSSVITLHVSISSPVCCGSRGACSAPSAAAIPESLPRGLHCAQAHRASIPGRPRSRPGRRTQRAQCPVLARCLVSLLEVLWLDRFA